MEYTSKFLGTSGLTSAEANYTANIVKELCEKINNEVKQMSLFSSVLIYKDKEQKFNKEYKVDNLLQKCMEEGNLYGLSAWLRTAIKEKQSLIDRASIDTFGLETLKMPDNPVTNKLPTEEDIQKFMSIAELAEYLCYEAKAAHLGKKVHPNGTFDSWFKTIRNTPLTQLHPDNKEYVISLTQIVDEKDLYETFFALQKEYREAEQKVNYYKAKVKNLHSDKVREVNVLNNEITANWREAFTKLSLENNIIVKEIENKRLEKIKEISELKIIIPNSLQTTMEFIQTYSKK